MPTADVASEAVAAVTPAGRRSRSGPKSADVAKEAVTEVTPTRQRRRRSRVTSHGQNKIPRRPQSRNRGPPYRVGSDHCRAGWSMARASVAICRTQLFQDHRLQCARLRIRQSPCSAQKAGSAALASLSKFLACTRVANARPAAIRRRNYRTK